MTSVPPNDPILAMLDSLEEAIAQDLPAPTPSVERELQRTSLVGTALAPPGVRKSYPDPPPRSAGVGARVQGSTAKVLQAFKWGH